MKSKNKYVDHALPFFIASGIVLIFNQLFTGMITDFEKNRLESYYSLFESDVLFVGMFTMLASQILFVIRDFLKEKISGGGLLASFLLTVFYMVIYTVAYISIRDISHPSWLFILVNFILGFIVDLTVYQLESYSPNILQEANKPCLGKKHIKPSGFCCQTVFQRIDSHFLIILILIMITPLVILSFFLTNMYPLFNSSMAQINSYELQFVSDIVFVGFFSLFVHRLMQIMEDSIHTDRVSEMQVSISFALSLDLVLIYQLIYSIFLRPINTKNLFLAFMIYSIAFAIVLDFVASCAFRETDIK